MTSSAEADALKASIDSHFKTSKETYVDKVSVEARVLLIWIDYLRKSPKNPSATRLLDAVQGAVIETAGCLTLGLVRPAIFSLRIQLELLVAWIFFDDHRIEWGRVEGGREFPMRSFYLKYMNEYGDKFPERMKILEDVSKRKHKDPYGILSIYVHSTSPYSAPQVGPLSAMVFAADKCGECVLLQRDIAEYLCDLLASWNVKRWHDLPEEIRSHITSRMDAKALKAFTN